MKSGSSKLKAQSSTETPTCNGNSFGRTSAAPKLFGDVLYGVGPGFDPMILREGPDVPGGRHRWDLEERVTVFGEKVVRFSKRIPRHPTNERLINQLVGAGTSTGANYCEANEAVSPKDFKYTLGRCMKEAKETKFFLRMVVASEPALASEARALYREAHELLRIFGAMRKR